MAAVAVLDTVRLTVVDRAVAEGGGGGLRQLKACSIRGPAGKLKHSDQCAKGRNVSDVWAAQNADLRRLDYLQKLK